MRVASRTLLLPAQEREWAQEQKWIETKGRAEERQRGKVRLYRREQEAQILSREGESDS